MGMMPSNEIEIREEYDDGNGLIVRIDAGPNGWTIRYADNGSKYQDTVATTQENRDTAYAILVKEFPRLKKVEDVPVRRVVYQSVSNEEYQSSNVCSNCTNCTYNEEK